MDEEAPDCCPVRRSCPEGTHGSSCPPVSERLRRCAHRVRYMALVVCRGQAGQDAAVYDPCGSCCPQPFRLHCSFKERADVLQQTERIQSCPDFMAWPEYTVLDLLDYQYHATACAAEEVPPVQYCRQAWIHHCTIVYCCGLKCDAPKPTVPYIVHRTHITAVRNI